MVLAAPISAVAEADECMAHLRSNRVADCALCMLAAGRSDHTRSELQLLQGLSADPYGQEQQHQRIYQSDLDYRRAHDQNMMLNHGMGGCTPNFATGGCL